MLPNLPCILPSREGPKDHDWVERLQGYVALLQLLELVEDVLICMDSVAVDFVAVDSVAVDSVAVDYAAVDSVLCV
jgi:hypothetical protein